MDMMEHPEHPEHPGGPRPDTTTAAGAFTFGDASSADFWDSFNTSLSYFHYPSVFAAFPPAAFEAPVGPSIIAQNHGRDPASGLSPTCASAHRTAAAAAAAAAGTLSSHAFASGHQHRLSMPRGVPASHADSATVLSDIAGFYAAAAAAAASTPQHRAPGRGQQAGLSARPPNSRHGAQLIWTAVPTTPCLPVDQTSSAASASLVSHAGPVQSRGQGQVVDLNAYTPLNLVNTAGYVHVPATTALPTPPAVLTTTPYVPAAVPGLNSTSSTPYPTQPPANINTAPTAPALSFSTHGDCTNLPRACDPSWRTPDIHIKEDPAAAVGHVQQQPSPSPSPSPPTTITAAGSPNGAGIRLKTQESEGSSSKHPSPSPLPTPNLQIVEYKPVAGTKRRAAVEEEVALQQQGMSSQPLRQVELHDGEGKVTGTLITLGSRQKTRCVFTEEKRRQTALARKEGVCKRCKGSKRMCDLAQQRSLYVSCTLCATTRLYKNAPRNPCFKVTLQDILFFRAGPAPNEPLHTPRSTVYQLKDVTEPNVPVRTLRLTQHIGTHELTVYASEFTPLPGDVVSYKWTDRSGAQHELKMPHFCLTNIDKIHAHFRQYIVRAKWSYLESLVQRGDDELAWMTVSTAMAYARQKPGSLVADALDLWAISRMIEIPWQMCGEDTLGVERVKDKGSPHFGKIPIPPIMDTQLDQVVIQRILKPLRQSVVDKFEHMITPAKPEAWWEVYLASFVLLNHIERLARHSVDHARTHTMRTKYSNTQFLEAVFHTAKSILARFHFVCNGSAPLRLDWTSPKAAAMAKLDREQVEFMKQTQALIAAKEKEVLALRSTHKYENTLYWCGQLFTEDFDTSPARVVVEEVEEVGADLRGCEGPELPPDRRVAY